MFRKLGLIVAISLLSSASAFAAPPACNATSEGTLAYDSDRKIMAYCDGDEWKGLGGSFGGGGSGSTVWLDGATSGEIFYNAGNVGIGTNDPSALLSVAYSATSRVDLSGAHLEIGRNEAASPTTGGFIDLKKLIADDTRVRLEFKPDEDGGAGAFGIGTDADGGTYSAVRRLTILGGSGFVAIGPGAPKTRLDVAGTLRIGNGSELCNVADHEGAMRYVGAIDAFEMCRNSAIGWEPLGSGSGGSDNLGDHTATQDLAMAGFKVSDTSAVELKLIAGNAPLGTPGGGGVLPGLGSSKIWIGDAGGAAAAVNVSGDATLSNAGVLTIGSNAIGSAEIIDGSITGADIANTTIPVGKISASGTAGGSTYLRGDGSWAAPSSSLPGLMSANLWVGNGLNVATAVTLSGDATMTNAGVLTLSVDSVTSAEIADSTITTNDIAPDTITAADIAAGAVGTSEIADGSVANADLAGSIAVTKLVLPGGTTNFLRSDGSWAAPSGGGGGASCSSVTVNADCGSFASGAMQHGEAGMRLFSASGCYCDNSKWLAMYQCMNGVVSLKGQAEVYCYNY